MDILKFWREKGWQQVDGSIYRDAYKKFGGSVITHPDIIEEVSRITNMPLRYMAQYQGEELAVAIPVWGKYLAGSKKALKKAGKQRLLDTGNPEVILPIAQDWRGRIPFKGDFLSSLHMDCVNNLKQSKSLSVSLARSYQPGVEHSLSKKFKYNKRRELRLFEEAGGKVESISNLSTEELVRIYTTLFKARWGFEIKGSENLYQFLGSIRDHLTGFYLVKDGECIAIQLLLTTESPSWISVEYINGGVNPEYADFSPGSILSYLNTSSLEEAAKSKGKSLRFSFGKTDKNYKDLWCYRSKVYSV